MNTIKKAQYRLYVFALLAFFLTAAPTPGAAGTSGESGAPTVPASSAAEAEDATETPGIFARFADRVKQTWNSDSYDLYVPVNTWHNRLLYDDSKIEKYNEFPLGVGFGKSMFDEDGDWHALYAMGFADSHNQFQPIVGYGFIKNKYLDENRDFAVGAGFTLSITARHQYDYIPLPLPLPLVSIQYKRFAVQAAYIPGTYNNGNVLFTWVRWTF